LNDVAIDITRLLGRFLKKRLPTGVDRVSLEYIRHFSSKAHAIVRVLGRTLVFSIDDSQALFSALLKSDFSLRANTVWRVTKAFLSIKPRLNLHGIFLFNTGHSGLERADYPAHLAMLGVKPIFFVHDLIPITHPQYCRVGEKEKHIVRMTTLLQLAKGVIANSQFTLDSLDAFAKEKGIAVPEATVALLAPATMGLSHQARPIHEPYFVILSTIEPRKNHALLLKIWRDMIEQNLPSIPRLVIIGQRGWDVDDIIKQLEQDEALKPHVLELSSCSDETLANYLQHAQALLFPSFVEGFGMPLVEALSIGVPVIASDISAFHEISGDIPEYIDPTNTDAWRQKIQHYCEQDNASRNAQLQRIRNFQAASWPQHFQKVEALLEKLP
jgi:glycosyltransferase involved in cell wall biosynthesis